MTTLVELKTKRFFSCPNGCEYDFCIEHLFEDRRPTTAGPWFCDHCGHSWFIEIKNDQVYVQENSSKKYRQYVKLEIPPQTHPITLVVQGVRFEAKEDVSHTRYYYEEHTCPTNYFRDVLEIYLGNERDPHGLAKYLTTFDAISDVEEPEENPKRIPSGQEILKRIGPVQG